MTNGGEILLASVAAGSDGSGRAGNQGLRGGGGNVLGGADELTGGGGGHGGAGD